MSTIKWTTEKRLLKELLPAMYNPRKLSKKGYEDLKSSLEKFNLAELPAVNKDNTILAGHMRIRIMGDIYGLNHEIEVRVASRQLTEEECKEYNIRSNKNTGEWDFDMLANHFQIEELKAYGFEDFELGFMKDQVPVMDQDDLTKTMDSYLNGNIKQIVLFFKNEDYEKMIQKLEDIMKLEGVDNHTDAFIKILAGYEENLSQKK